MLKLEDMVNMLKDKQSPNGTTSTKSSSSGLGLGSANQPSPSTQLVILSMIISIVTSIILDMVQGLGEKILMKWLMINDSTISWNRE